MNQTPAALLVLAASVFSYVAHAASMTSYSQTSVLMTLCAIGLGVWGIVSLVVAGLREREALIDNHARLDILDKVLVREPWQAIRRMTRPAAEPRTAAATPPPIQPESAPLELTPEAAARLRAVSERTGRDRSQILDEVIRQHLTIMPPQSRVA